MVAALSLQHLGKDLNLHIKCTQPQIPLHAKIFEPIPKHQDSTLAKTSTSTPRWLWNHWCRYLGGGGGGLDACSGGVSGGAGSVDAAAGAAAGAAVVLGEGSKAGAPAACTPP